MVGVLSELRNENKPSEIGINWKAREWRKLQWRNYYQSSVTSSWSTMINPCHGLAGNAAAAGASCFAASFSSCLRRQRSLCETERISAISRATPVCAFSRLRWTSSAFSSLVCVASCALAVSSSSKLSLRSIWRPFSIRVRLASGYSCSASHRSSLDSTNRSEYPTLRMFAVRRLPFLLPATHIFVFQRHTIFNNNNKQQQQQQQQQW